MLDQGGTGRARLVKAGAGRAHRAMGGGIGRMGLSLRRWPGRLTTGTAVGTHGGAVFDAPGLEADGPGLGPEHAAHRKEQPVQEAGFWRVVRKTTPGGPGPSRTPHVRDFTPPLTPGTKSWANAVSTHWNRVPRSAGSGAATVRAPREPRGSPGERVPSLRLAPAELVQDRRVADLAVAGQQQHLAEHLGGLGIGIGER